uniref:U38-Theraphotoxin-Ct1a_1 n=1 Tax=Coremiocnemis tropix TaxID=1904443 RepID=A0A482ZI81_CORTR
MMKLLALVCFALVAKTFAQARCGSSKQCAREECCVSLPYTSRCTPLAQNGSACSLRNDLDIYENNCPCTRGFACRENRDSSQMICVPEA